MTRRVKIRSAIRDVRDIEVGPEMTVGAINRSYYTTRRWQASRGQVLLVAVLVLFGVATLAALFVGILGSRMAQVTRAADISALGQMAEGGLRAANQNLTYSVRGARLAAPSRPYQVDKGQVLVRVNYGPTPGDLQSRYILVSSTATFPDNPFVSYTILGVKSLLLTDYARCITDLYELRQAAALGVAGVEGMGSHREDYTFRINGPVFSNTDLVWYGNSEVNLTTSSQRVDLATTLAATWGGMGVLRDDRIEVAGALRSPVDSNGNSLAAANPLRLTVNGETYADNVFLPGNEVAGYRYVNGFWDMTPPSPPYRPVLNSWRVLADLPTCRPSWSVANLIGRAYSVPRVQPPRMDSVDPDLGTNRYLTLTRDSGPWQPVGSTYINLGAWGWGWVYGGGIVR